MLGAVSAVAVIAWQAQVGEDHYSYPFTAAGYTAAQILFAVQHLGMLAGISALAMLARSRAGRTRPCTRRSARGRRRRSAVCAAWPGPAPFAGSCLKWRVPESQVHWVNTFGFILLPGVLAGTLLGWGLRRPRPVLALAPLLFAAVLLSNPFDLPSLFEADHACAGSFGAVEKTSPACRR